jgi:hypothetical protein
MANITMKSTIALILTAFSLSNAFLLSGSSRRLSSYAIRHETSLPSSIASSELESPRTLIRKGMQSFRDGDVSASLDYFDRADNAVDDGSLKPYLWQRGISYYYLDQFRKGSDQVSYYAVLFPRLVSTDNSCSYFDSVPIGCISESVGCGGDSSKCCIFEMYTGLDRTNGVDCNVSGI